MTRQQKHELLMELLAVQRNNVDIERAHELASMAIHMQFPDKTFSEEEHELWVDYRIIVLEHEIANSEDYEGI